MEDSAFFAYFEPFELPEQPRKGTLGAAMEPWKESSSLRDYPLAVFAVPEFRFAASEGLDVDYAQVVAALANLYPGSFEPKILMLGTLRTGATVEDTEAAVADVLSELVMNRVTPIILGGTGDLMQALYRTWVKMEQVVNITSCDPQLHIQQSEEAGVIGKIIKSQPNFLFNYSNLGYQTYLCDPAELQLADELYFDVYRLGELRGNVYSAEPMIRSSEIFHLSMNAVKASDFHSALWPQPNGFYAEEVCQMMRYAGLGEKLRVALISDFHTEGDSSDSLLIAELIWCFLDGFYARKTELPHANNAAFLKYRVSLKDDEFHLIFYKSLKTDRWWMEVPVPPQYANKYRKHHLIPCSYEDYQMAAQDDLPDRWWKAYKKML